MSECPRSSIDSTAGRVRLKDPNLFPCRKRAGLGLAAKKRKDRIEEGTAELSLNYSRTGTGTLTADDADGTEEGWIRSSDNNMEDRNIRSAERSGPIFLS